MRSCQFLAQQLGQSARCRQLLPLRHIRLYSGCCRPGWLLRPTQPPAVIAILPLVRRPFAQAAGGDKPPAVTKIGLADQIMAAKVAEAASREQAASSSEQPGSGTGSAADQEAKSEKGPQPMPKWQKYSYIALGVLMGSSLVGNAVLFSLPDKDEQGNNIEDEYSSLPFPSQYYYRLKNKIFSTKKAIEEPFSDKLLPDPLEPPYYQPKYTVVLELTGLLVHSNWTHKHGWRFQKRPGLDIFLSQIGYPNFEVVIWTVENGMTFFPIINGMDPQGQYIMYRLFRDATHYINGHHCKDLSRLNRDLKKVIVIDWNKETIQAHPDNALVLKKWEGENNDRTLIGLAQLLQEVRESGVEDVRDVLSYYRQFEDPVSAFRENQRKLEEELRLEEERKKKEQEKSRFSNFGFSSFNKFRR